MPLLDNEELEINRLKILADYLFGTGAGEALLSEGEVRIEYSKSTGRVRHVFVNGKRVLSFRPSDGTLVLTIEGARRLLKAIPPPRLRVVIKDEAIDFVKKGRSVFAKHVLVADSGIRPGMEVIVVDKHDSLVAIGRAVLSGEEMLIFNRGVAVKVRQGVANEKNKSP